MMKTVENIIIKPIITERSMDGVANKRYTFRVDGKATKPEIARAVETMFDVKVAKVNTLNVKKKAIVTLTSDSKTIPFFDSMN